MSPAPDVVVIGGGPAGCAVAMELTRRGVPTLVVDGGTRTSWPGESLPPGASRIIEPVFGPRPLANPRHRIAYGNRSAWGSDELRATDFLFNPLGSGWHLDRTVFDADLQACVSEQGGQLIAGRVTAATREKPDASWRVTLADGRVFLCRHLVDATGRSAQFALRQGIRRIHEDRQVALVGTFATGEDDEDSTTLVEAVRDGWWYASPLPGGRRVVAWVTDGDLLPREPTAHWRAALRETRHVSATIAGCEFPAQLTASPAGTSSLTMLHGPGWLAVGDAAIAWDPLSSQGLVTAILMGGRAGAAISDRLDGRGDETLHAWADDYRELLRGHLEERRDFARAERRWPESPFWSRRQRDDNSIGVAGIAE